MSVESIIAELPEHFVRLMQNWARGNAGGGMYAISSIYDGVDFDRYRESSVPVLSGEVEDVDRALARMTNRYRQAVMLFWQYDRPTMAWLGRRLHVDYRTAEARVRDGHNMLQAELSKQRDEARRYADAARAARVDNAVL